MNHNVTLSVGEPAPWFVQRGSDPQGPYHFDKSAGRYSVMFFFHSSCEVNTARALERVQARRDVFDGRNTLFFGVTNDSADEERMGNEATHQGLHFFWDGDGKVSGLYGFAPAHPPLWMIVDPMLRITAIIAQQPGAADMILDLIGRVPQLEERVESCAAPVLLLADIFEPEFCRRMLNYYQERGAEPSGVYTEREVGRSQAVIDTNFKRRRDCRIEDATLVDLVQQRITRKIVPEIQKSYQFNASRLERLIIGCYDAQERGRFGAHRDNTIKAAEHRRFAVSINLNEGFVGGGVSFPEFGARSFAPPAGGALIFSCGLMHKVEPVTQGRRFACLTFLYDEEAAKLRARNWEAARAAARGEPG